MKFPWKCFLFIFTAIFVAAVSGCPEKTEPPQPETHYHVGTWGGHVFTEARLVLREDPDYWNRAWRIETTIDIDEFDDGSLSGVAHVQLFAWDTHNGLILDYEDIATGRWDQYAMVDLNLHGSISDEGYEITADELPVSLPNPNDPTGIIDFWDFLYPTLLEGVWPEDGSRTFSGESMRVQGDDYEDVRRLEAFREFSLQYTWDIDKL